MSLAVISTAFTGQAIAVAFDRRYGALKRIGATALPVWGIIAGKSLAVVTVVFLQSIVLGGIGFALGWRPHIVALMLGAVIIALGTAGFAAMGLLLGGTLRAEIVLAVANLLWFVFAGLGALTLEGQAVPKAVQWAARLTPSGALTEALSQAMSLSVDWFGFAVLAVWAPCQRCAHCAGSATLTKPAAAADTPAVPPPRCCASPAHLVVGKALAHSSCSRAISDLTARRDPSP